MRGRFTSVVRDDVWSKVIALSLIMFFANLSDSILSYWAPNFIQGVFNDAFKMGLIISFSSVVGIIADITFPQIIKKMGVKRIFLYGIGLSILYAVLMLFSTFRPYLILLFIAMSVWGVYYELYGFGRQQFVAQRVPRKLHSSAWGVLSGVRGLAFFIGPVLAALLLTKGFRIPLVYAIALSVIAFIGMLFTKSRRENTTDDINFHQMNILTEIKHWKVLFVHVWPLIILSLLLGLIDATFWTTGAVWSQKLASGNILGGMFLSVYMLPTIFVSFLLARWKIEYGKRKLAIKLTALAGIFLIPLGFYYQAFAQLALVLVSAIFLAMALPLTNAVYSDIVERMGRERKHLIGLSLSTWSIAYIVGPIVAGFIARSIGEAQTFTVLGVFAVIVSLILLITSPNQLRLPQKEIKTWE